MDLPRDFLSYNNFDLAFDRIVRGGNKEYKQYYRHLFPSYNLALKENLNDLIGDLRRGTFKPEKPTVVYQPKKSGVLRPLTLLTLSDLIVYQAILNRVAASFEDEQQKFAFTRMISLSFSKLIAAAPAESLELRRESGPSSLDDASYRYLGDLSCDGLR
jgi:hypothetical protein